MKLTVLSHACLLIESGPDRLLIDPWILGSCYWRSWWHCPEARPEALNPASISAIYFTHEHSDHLHFPSLRRFAQTTRILVPRFPVDRMARALHDRGYSNCEEIPHGSSAQVGALQVHSYQHGTDDSIVAITDGQTTVLNLNDAKVGGLSLRHILKRHPPIDFLLRSHSPAQAYPFCYTADDPKDLALLPLSYYTDSFIAAVQSARPKYAVPFASNVCHLHPESRAQNAHMVSPQAVAQACRGKISRTEAVVMTPGDSWRSGEGFTQAPQRGKRDAEIQRLLKDKKTKLAQADAEEKAIPPIDFDSFRGYAERFARAVPWPLRKMYASRVAFAMPSGELFIIDLGYAQVTRAAEGAGGLHSIVRADPHLLRDAIEKEGLNLVGISKRLRVHLCRGGLIGDAAFWGLLTIFELGYLPLSNLLTPRAAAVLFSRWREFIGYIPVFLRPKKSLELVIESALPRPSP